ncbi:MAG: lipopolysaccharide heptosyltransferase II, partial [Acidobacteria bacterium]|nr:lipopolysaccharide heptosyltransferase II [Acidobacteriota bacterium]
MKILVRGTNWIGDAIMSIPALRELRRIFPDAHIALHTRSWADGLFRDTSFIDELITFDSNRWKIRDIYNNSQFLKEDQFDLAVLFPNSFESAITTFITRIPRRIGYNKDVRGLLLTDPIAVPEWKNRKHEVYYYLSLVSEVEKRVLGRDTVSAALPNAALEISDERKQEARQFLDSSGADLSRPMIALGPGSTNSRAKRWPAERFSALAGRLVRELNADVIVMGSTAEADVTAAVTAGSAHRLIDLTGKTDIGEAAAILSVVDLMISNDMGLAHIA